MSQFTHLTSEGENTVEFSYNASERTLTIGGESYECDGESLWLGGVRTPFWVHRQREVVSVWLDGEVFTFTVKDPRRRDAAGGGASGDVTGAVKAQMPGKVLSVAVKVGDSVARGQNLLVMESMKMELALDAPCEGVVESLDAIVGQMVSMGDILARVVAPSS